MEGRKDPPKVSQVRKLESFVIKLSEEEISMFLLVLKTIMSQVPAPKDARKSYLKEVEVRLRHNGVDFLAKSRSFPTFGLKLLSQDRNGFPISGFKKQPGKIYPALFSWYWSELDRLSVVSKPTKADVLRAQRVLCVLSFAKMIKTSSVNQIRKSLEDFESRVTSGPTPKSSNLDKGASPTESGIFISQRFGRFDTQRAFNYPSIGKEDSQKYVPDPSLPDTPESYFAQGCPSLQEVVGDFVELDKLPQYVDLDSISTKPSALREEPAFPEWFDTQFWGGIRRAVERQRGVDYKDRLFGLKKPPYGRVHVLTESAGKLRLILPYNTPFVHSTGLFARCRAYLRGIKGDYSENQAAGHRYVQRGTGLRDGEKNISADLSNFSDDISAEALTFGLRSLDLQELESYLFNLPVSLPNGKIITPKKLLMGLKGCFEFSTLLHHYVVRRKGITKYAMCGDDFYFRGNLDTYLDAISQSGWSLNRGKTVVSATAAVFCGEYYWLGHRVSPRVPKVSSFFRNGKLADTTVLFSSTRDTIVSLNQIYNRRSVARVIGPFIRLLRSRWKLCIFPELPAKLRGLGMKPSRPGRGLLKVLKKRAVLRCSLLSIGRLKEEIPRHRWFGIPVELSPSGIQREFPDFPALLKRGAVRLDVPKTRKGRKDVDALDIYDVLEWYYNDVRYEF